MTDSCSSRAIRERPGSRAIARAFAESIMTWTGGLSLNAPRANSSTPRWAFATSRVASPSPWTTMLRWLMTSIRISATPPFSAALAPHLSRMERTSLMVETFRLAATAPPHPPRRAESKGARRMISSIESSSGLASRYTSSRRLHTSSITVASLMTTRLRMSGSALASSGSIRHSLKTAPSSPMRGSFATDRALILRLPMPGRPAMCI